MKGLLLKDFYVTRDGLLTLLLTFIAVGAGLAFLVSPGVLIIIAATTLSLQAAATIQNDKSTQWNKFSATLPVSRAQVVGSKYLMYLLLCIAGIAFGIAVCSVVSLFKQGFDVNGLIEYSCLAVVVSLLPGSISIPCAFIFDEEKSVMGLVLSYMVTAGLFSGLIVLLKQFMDVKGTLYEICGIAAVFGVLVFALSWLICPKRIAQRDI